MSNIFQLRPPGRAPKTARGVETKGKILAAARILATERWIHEVPFTALAQTAGVARASLLHCFGNWSDVMSSLFHEEIRLLDQTYGDAKSMKGAHPAARAFAMLSPLIDRAESTGLLYPNLRSVMFTWHGQPTEQEMLAELRPGTPPSAATLSMFALIDLSDFYAAAEDLLGIQPAPRRARSSAAQPSPHPYLPAPIGECLVNVTLDLAAGSPSTTASFDGRRETLRRTIKLIAVGVSKTHSGR